MSKEEIFKKLKIIFKQIMGDKVNINDITLSTKISQKFEMTSIAFIYLIFALEKEFKIDLSKVSYTTFVTVQDVVDLIYVKIN